MRIIAGKHKGHILKTPRNIKIRPTSDRIRENVFNILSDQIKDSAFLDLFAGTGAMGLEAISRGARAVFCDADKDSVQLIKANLACLNEEAKVLSCNYSVALSQLQEEEFDWIFVDPFYNMDVAPILQLIKKYQVLKKEGIVIYERNAKTHNSYSGYYLLDQRKYGNTAIDFLRINDEEMFGNR